MSPISFGLCAVGKSRLVTPTSALGSLRGGCSVRLTTPTPVVLYGESIPLVQCVWMLLKTLLICFSNVEGQGFDGPGSKLLIEVLGLILAIVLH